MIKPALVLAFSVFVASCGSEQKGQDKQEAIESPIVVEIVEDEPVESLNSEQLKVSTQSVESKPYTLEFVESNQTIPNNALRYKRDLYRFAQSSFGINAPIGMLAAQIHKESTWREDAESPYAIGLSQFTPDTQADIKRKYPELAYGDALNPIWAIHAMMIYDADLKAQVDSIDECNDWAFTLAMYNGGPGWIWREKNLAESNGVDRNQYWQAVEEFNAGRREDAKKENRGYPKKIILELQSLYVNNGWGGTTVCY